MTLGERLACPDGHARLVLDVQRSRYLVCESLAECLILNRLLHDLVLRLSPGIASGLVLVVQFKIGLGARSVPLVSQRTMLRDLVDLGKRAPSVVLLARVILVA